MFSCEFSQLSEHWFFIFLWVLGANDFWLDKHCVKSARIRCYSDLHFFLHSDWIRRDTEYLAVFSPNARKWGPEWLQIRTLFTQLKGSKCLLSNAKFVLQKVLTCENFSGKGRFQKIVIYIILIKSYFLTKPPCFFKKITKISLYFNHQVNGYVFSKIIPLNLRKYELHLLWANHYRFEGAMNSSLGPTLNKICF